MMSGAIIRGRLGQVESQDPVTARGALEHFRMAQSPHCVAGLHAIRLALTGPPEYARSMRVSTPAPRR